MAFDFKIWLKDGLKNGYKDGSFSMPYIVTMTANYIAAGMLTNEDAAEIAAACTAWDEEKTGLEAEEEQAEQIDPGFTQPLGPETTPAENTGESAPAQETK